MATSDKIFSSKVKYKGIFNFADYYKFCHDFLVEEFGFSIEEKKYVEKLAGDTKTIEVEWEATKKINEYFKFAIKIEFKADQLKQVEVIQNNVKLKTNEGSVETKVGGTLVKDYDGKFETSGAKMFMRAIYEKWVISSGIRALEDKLSGWCDEFLSQAKAFLDLEGKK